VPSRAIILPDTVRNAASTGVIEKYHHLRGILMQNADETSSAENIQASSSLPARGSRVGHLLIAALAALGAGLAASLMAVILMGVLRLAAGVPTPVELFGDHVLKLLSAPRFVDLLIKFSPNSKTAPLGLTLLGMIGAGTVLGLLYALAVRVMLPVKGYRPKSREWLTAAALAIGMTLVAVVLFWGEIGQNFFGLPLVWAMLVTALCLLADFSLYGLTLCLAYRALLPKQPVANVPARIQGRRQLLARAGVAVLSVSAGAGSLELIRSFLHNDNFTAYDGTVTSAHNGVTAPITPNNEHYIVTQNPVDPTANPDVWRLEITGLVRNPGTYTYEELKNLPSTSRAVTLECIANGPGGRLISTAVWQGVTLRTLLEKHGGALPNARFVAFYSIDGYSVSQPLDEVLAADALLAWHMNGVPVPNRHGFPLRALIPGRYGEENAKWLTRVELTDHFVSGLYADQGWYYGPLHTMNRIDRPRGHLALGQTIEIGGIAFAGTRGIEKVEVSVDDGVTWHEATLDPALSQDAWVLWSWQWKPSLPGQYTLVARATDGTGEVQTSRKQGTVPDGATGYHEVVVQVG
jgi:DMSO/TMAO reductase YedYZ molybdopterin-dependent catalytic subunit